MQTTIVPNAAGAPSTPLLRALLLTVSLLLYLALAAPTALAADSFPWQATISAESSTVRAEASESAQAVGDLQKGAWVAVLSESGDWYQTPVGFVRKPDVSRSKDQWVGELSRDVDVLHKPNSRSAVDYSGTAGQLVRVTGVAPGVPLEVGGQPDAATYWTTTLGYVPLDAVRSTQNEWAAKWTLPSADEALNGWWGSVESRSNVRVGPTTDAPRLGQFKGNERLKVLAEVQGKPVDGNDKWYKIDGGKFPGAYVHSTLITRVDQPTSNTSAPEGQSSDTWIVVDRGAHSLTLVKDGQAAFTTFAALGKAATETPSGRYSTYGKLVHDSMSSENTDADATYHVPNVPSVQYYLEGGYAIHGTYWHDEFGAGTSQGCVNISQTDAAYLFSQTEPEVGEQGEAYDLQGATPVLITG